MALRSRAVSVSGARGASRRATVVAIGLLLAAGALVTGHNPIPLGPVATVHGLVTWCLLSAAAGLGVSLAGVAIEFLLSVEVLHKLLLGTVVAGPLAFADNAATPAEPVPGADRHLASLPRGAQFGLYGGGNSTPDADVILKQPNGTDMLLKDVPFTGEPFDDPPFYGLRATWWRSSFGAMLDYTHAKSISRRKEVVSQSGTRDGKPVPPREPVSKTFTKLEYSHGMNTLTLNALYRFTGWQRRVIPYIGAGAGVAVPHTEIARKGIARTDWTYRYEVSGPAVQGLVGLDWRLPSRRWTVFSEYKAGYAINHTELNEGGYVKANLWVHQAIVGVSASFAGGAVK